MSTEEADGVTSELHERTSITDISSSLRQPSEQRPVTHPALLGNGNSSDRYMNQDTSDVHPSQATRNHRAALDDQDYTPADVERPRPAKSSRPSQPVKRNDSRRPDDESARPRPVKSARSETQQTPALASGPPRSLWVCDRCFKYMPIESAYVSHTVSSLEEPTFQPFFPDKSVSCDYHSLESVCGKLSPWKKSLRKSELGDLGNRWAG